MTDAVITAALQSAPAGGIVIAILVLLLRRESSSYTTNSAREKAWQERERNLQSDIRDKEKTIDEQIAKRRQIEDEFAQYRREHP